MPSRQPGPNEHLSPGLLARGQALFEAYERAQVLAPAAIYQKTGHALGEVLKGLLPGLMQMLIILGATTSLGAAAGGVIGFFFGGAGAAPGAVIGGELGFDIGTAILTWIGVGFLAKAIVQGFGEIWAHISAGVTLAWTAPECPPKDYPHQIEQAAQELADAAGTLVLVILQAIVAWVLARAGAGATKAAVATGQSVGRVGSEAVADEAVTAVVEQLRGSRLGSYFADWVEKNWPRLKNDPRLRFKARSPTSSAEDMPASVNARRRLDEKAVEDGKPAVNKAAVQAWKDSLQTRSPAGQNMPDARAFQIRNTGDSEYLVKGGGQEVWADGINTDQGLIQDAKYVSNPDRSPFVPDSQIPGRVRNMINRDIEDEFQRYAAVVNDANTPVNGLQIITNNSRAVPYFEGLMQRYGIPGTVDVKP